MRKTSYQNFLERTRDRIIQNVNDPSRFIRVELCQRLFGLEVIPKKKPLDAWLAMLWSGQARIRAPLWAVRMFEAIGIARLYNPDAKNLDKIFGFGAGPGETPEVLERMIQVRLNGLFREVWALTLLDYDIKDACKLVARRYQRDIREKDRDLPYRWNLGKGKDPGEYLRRYYGQWRKANDLFIKRAEADWLAWLSSNKEKYLEQFHVSHGEPM